MENMKNKLILLSFIIVVLFLPSCSEGKKISIVENGSSEYTIIISQTASKEEREAAALIRSVIEKSTGVRLELSDDWIDEKTTELREKKKSLSAKQTGRRVRMLRRDLSLCLTLFAKQEERSSFVAAGTEQSVRRQRNFSGVMWDITAKTRK